MLATHPKLYAALQSAWRMFVVLSLGLIVGASTAGQLNTMQQFLAYAHAFVIPFVVANFLKPALAYYETPPKGVDNASA